MKPSDFSATAAPATAADVAALHAVVRAQARWIAAQSATGLTDLLSLLQVEASRLSTEVAKQDVSASRALERLNAWTESLVWDTRGSADVEAGDAGGRAVHFVD